MKLLFDHNLSPRLVRLLADLSPDSQHASPHLVMVADLAVMNCGEAI
ncbi:MAG: DUF5615 family PIN-like protein [Synechococcales cyanobacterium CRU_2_2]|nr:DUF5615 family PIN-like protein [Synechococcales cyanobacterium CRU_2_2]